MTHFFGRTAVTTAVSMSFLMVSLGTLTPALAANPHQDGGAVKDKTTICHATGSVTHPYATITVSNSALDAHRLHQDGRDIIPAPPQGCVGAIIIPPPPPVPGPVIACVVSAGVTQTATTVTGTSGDDTIDCSMASPGKLIQGLDGNDTITGTQFDDVIMGGAGNDTITGLGGNDVIQGGAGNDTITGGEGDDVITGNDGDDTLSGGPGNDFLDGGLGADTLSGGGGIDVLIGGGGGADTCNGVPCPL